MRVKGNGLVGRVIKHGDIVFVDLPLEPRADVVVARVGDELLVSSWMQCPDG
ncbi:LexA family transcriptional regulator [Gluconobacter thailandicus]|uniref:hypothetical protein n=1 Tax=Gluconobacter thailandicus TaxID=257438 RepID=UPI001E440B83|nr:hypothetical protein [Gluconobacter thailandicus]